MLSGIDRRNALSTESCWAPELTVKFYSEYVEQDNVLCASKLRYWCELVEEEFQLGLSDKKSGVQNLDTHFVVV